LCAVLGLCASPSARAQQTLGSLNGTVTDSSGAVVQGAHIQARALATNLEVSADTKSDGSFSIADLPIGTVKYIITIFSIDFHGLTPVRLRASVSRIPR